MPCTDGGVPYPPTQQEVLEAKMPAALCGLLKVLLERFGETTTVDLLRKIDHKEAGVDVTEILIWWEEHRQHDLERLRRSAAAKLTPAEREAVGLKR